MESKEFKSFRQRMGKTQRQIAQLLGTSLKAIHSYEQGWRNIPVHVERQMFFLISRMRGNNKERKSCWVVKKCPSEIKEQCPAWEFQLGNLCWLVNGTFCCGDVCKDWKEKMECCRSCTILMSLM